MLGFGHSRGGRRAYWGTIDSPRGESIFATGVPKSIIWHALARQIFIARCDGIPAFITYDIRIRFWITPPELAFTTGDQSLKYSTV